MAAEEPGVSPPEVSLCEAFPLVEEGCSVAADDVAFTVLAAARPFISLVSLVASTRRWDSRLRLEQDGSTGELKPEKAASGYAVWVGDEAVASSRRGHLRRLFGNSGQRIVPGRMGWKNVPRAG